MNIAVVSCIRPMHHSSWWVGASVELGEMQLFRNHRDDVNPLQDHNLNFLCQYRVIFTMEIQIDEDITPFQDHNLNFYFHFPAIVIKEILIMTRGIVIFEEG